MTHQSNELVGFLLAVFYTKSPRKSGIHSSYYVKAPRWIKDFLT